MESSTMKAIRDAGRRTGRCMPNDCSRELPVSSRRTALETLRKAASLEPAGPILLTGEPGTGKTWLSRSLLDDLEGQWGCVSIAMSEALDPLDFLQLIGEGMGIETGERIGGARVALARALEDDMSDRRSWMLVLENAQNASQQVWNEVLALVHAMEGSRGFALMILAGPTELARGLAARSKSMLASRIVTHVHLLPLDLDEACELVELRGDLGPIDRAVLDELHREASGNPRRLLQVMQSRHRRPAAPSPASTSSAPMRSPESTAEHDVTVSIQMSDPEPGKSPSLDRDFRESRGTGEVPLGIEAAVRPVEAPLVPSRPPLRVEEGLIEVGWEGSLEAESSSSLGGEAELPAVESLIGANELPSEEMVEDHYAALQAWSEWARNRGRDASRDLAEDLVSSERVASSVTSANAPSLAEIPRPAGLRAESQHEHAPYSQLFSRLRQSS
jgi:type II secretory pathway predicted ATPase ExeA